jgi:amino acid permease
VANRLTVGHYPSLAAQLVNWVVMAVTYVRWHKAMKVQGVSRDTLHFKSRFQPYFAYYAIACGRLADSSFPVSMDSRLTSRHDFSKVSSS